MRQTIILFTLVLALAGIAFGADIYVPDNYATIQGAINAASNGDNVFVRPGTYKEKIDFTGKAITVQALKGCTVTVIDGNYGSAVVTFTSGEGLNSVLDGFTVSKAVSPLGKGGVVIENSSPTIIDCSIIVNTSNAGGGAIYCNNGSPLIEGNNISGNIAAAQGGGAIRCINSSPTILRNFFVGNIGPKGAAILCDSGSSPMIVNNFFGQNHASSNGGGIYSDGSSPTIVNNTFVKNIGQTECGGIYNTGNSNTTVVNTILWGNDGGTATEIVNNAGSSISVTYSDVEGGWTGTGNINANPEFVEIVMIDTHILWTSPCRDAGTNSAPGLPSEDYEGDPRIANGTADIGADEFFDHLYHAGCNLKPGDPVVVRVIGTPGQPVILAMSAQRLVPPVSIVYGLLHLAMPLNMQLSIGSIPANGCLERNANIPLSWPAPRDYFFQALIGPMGNPNSRLTNLMIVPLI